MKNSIKIILIYFLFSCNNYNKTAETNEKPKLGTEEIVYLSDEQMKNSGLTTAKAELKTLTQTIEVNGILDVPPKHLVSLTAILGGYVRDVTVLQGMKVGKGQVLAVLENPDFLTLQQEYLESQAKLQFMKTDFERQQELSQNDIGSKREFQESQSNYKMMEARSNSLAEKIRMLNLSVNDIKNGRVSSKINIKSPIDGYVTVLNINMGSFVAPQTVMFEITDTEHLHAELYVYEKDISKIKKGQLVAISLANEANKIYEGKVFLINKRIEDDRTVRIHVHFLKHDDSMIPRTFIKASIEIDTKKCYTLPEKAMINSEDKTYIFLELKPGQYRFTEIKIGLTQNGFKEINPIDSLDFGKATFVINGAFSVLAKLKNVSDE